MNEPLLTYRKGQGRIYDNGILVEWPRQNLKFMIYERAPEIGEDYFCLGIGSIADERNPGFEGHVRWWANTVNPKAFDRTYDSELPHNYHCYAVSRVLT